MSHTSLTQGSGILEAPPVISPGSVVVPRARLDGFGLVLRRLYGTNPWPQAGRIGHLAMGAMSTEALGLLLVFLVPLTWAYPILVRVDFVAYFTAGTLISQGQAAQLYDAGRQLATQLQFLGD